MSEAGNHHDDIFLFEIAQPEVGFASFGKIQKRNSPATRKDALAEIMAGVDPNDWQDVSKKHTPGGLDMCFAPSTKALIFVQTPGLFDGVGTCFGDDGVVDLDIRGKGTQRFVHACKTYPEGSEMRPLCAFEIDIHAAISDIGNAANNHAITRLPIKFDFVDHPDRISPVFKSPHGKQDHAPSHIGHGGIHPPSGSSLIVVS
ncbi:hypothetical protein [Qipengyuania sp.]|uniref:hypothetical protein n=1 Tax=Qipengyuania sp. TaxID=2004515 RepID=UPI00351553D9